MYMCLFFFFSSRRRHTRYWRDWSSDVCSSDLDERAVGDADPVVRLVAVAQALEDLDRVGERRLAHLDRLEAALEGGVLLQRSEERRVGKECRSRWSPYH